MTYRPDEPALVQRLRGEPALRPVAGQLGIDLGRSVWLRDAERVLTARPGTLTLIAAGLVLYGLLEGVEGVGLWLAQRWGECLTAVATALLLPLEVREPLQSATLTMAVIFAVNLAVVAYLVIVKRLFGVRGGVDAYRRELRGESLLDEIEMGRRSARRPAVVVARQGHQESRKHTQR